jgi:hypothetical protein
MFAARRGARQIFLSEAARRAIGDPTHVAVTRGGKRGAGANSEPVYMILPAAGDEPDSRRLHLDRSNKPVRFSCSWLSEAMPPRERVPLAKVRGGLEVRL